MVCDEEFGLSTVESNNLKETLAFLLYLHFELLLTILNQFKEDLHMLSIIDQNGFFEIIFVKSLW